MPETPYILAVLAIVFTVTLALRALPFAALRTLRESVLVRKLSVWMPVGILGILAVSTLRTTLTAGSGNALPAAVAVAVTAAAHLLGGRRTLLSVGLGTLAYVVLENLF
ncbi:branched-chain amino acid transporter AzlD [Arthrobacter sp. Soil736]|uniref:branched-chain amino acid transporter permease n=1 Tax=Arthrobacter sp. Soil736 TaxID=1736395 RepID=UPI0006FC1573|nr:AzlD domain-containing protein [Arthrobacter sp. Soil736]KRE63878.1 branched-chain amino acid transporter AzlD [Arthrobacter sp. Soil736]